MKTKKLITEADRLISSESKDYEAIDGLIRDIKSKIEEDQRVGRILGPLIKKLSRLKEKPFKQRQSDNVKQLDSDFIFENKYVPIASVRNKIKECLGSDLPEDRALLEHLRRKERLLKALYKERQVKFKELKNGRLAIGPRPTFGKIDELSGMGVTTVVSLLKESEKNVAQLGKYINDSGMTWIWFPLSASKLSTTPVFKVKTNELYNDLIVKLSDGETLFIHCAAGIHRTGSFSNGLLLKMGYTPEQAKEIVYEMRPVSAIEAVAKHWNWSKKIIS